MTLLNNPKAGDFAAVCRQPNWVPQVDVPTDMDLASLQVRWDKKQTCNVFLIPCAMETKNRDELEAHMRDVHGGGSYRWDSATLDPAKASTVRTYKSRGTDIEKGWRGTPLKAEGRPFEPKDLEPGAEVTWPTGRTTTRSGQVWSAGPAPKSAWVIPDVPLVEQHPEKDLVRFERATLVKLDHRGEVYACADTVWSQWAELEDVA